MLSAQAVQYVVHIRRLSHCAIEVSRQKFCAILHPDPANLDDPLEVPLGVVAAQFDLQAGQAVAPNPIGQQHRIAIGWFVPGQLRVVEWVESAHEVPGGKFVHAL